MKTLLRALIAALLLLPSAASASDESDAFVEANLLAVFYHELGHALIDIEGIPIFGQEEDAADVFSIFLIDAVFEEEDAQQIAYETAWGFLGEAMLREGASDEIAWWDTHGQDEQRFYNMVCLFYGADPEERGEWAEELGLPEARAEFCPEEFDLAATAWGAILDEITSETGGDTIGFDYAASAEGSLTLDVVEAETAFLNEELRLSQDLWVTVEPCGEANAYYEPDERLVVMCSEFEDHLREMAGRF